MFGFFVVVLECGWCIDEVCELGVYGVEVMGCGDLWMCVV